MKSEKNENIINEVRQILDMANHDNGQKTSLQNANNQSQRRRRFAIGILLAAPFFGSMATLAWVQSRRNWSALFFLMATVLFLIGRWLYNKANDEEYDSSSDKLAQPTKKSTPAPVRRIK